MQSQTFICLFGRVRLLYESRVVEQFHTSKCRDLLAILALAPSHKVDRGTLIRLLWPGDRGTKANNRLSVCIYLLKKDLRVAGLNPDNMIVATPRTVALNPDEVTVDFDQFSKLIETGRTDGTRRRESFEMATSIYTGPLLEQVEENWTLMPRIQAERQFQEAALWLATEEGDPEIAKSILRSAVEKDPYSDDAAELMLTWLYQAGNRDESFAYAQQIVAGHSSRGTRPTVRLFDVIQKILGEGGIDRPAEFETPVTTTLGVDQAGSKSFDSVCERFSLFRLIGDDFAITSNPIAAHEAARLILAESPETRVLVHSAISDIKSIVSDEIRGLRSLVPKGEAWATISAAELIRAQNPAAIKGDASPAGFVALNVDDSLLS